MTHRDELLSMVTAANPHPNDRGLPLDVADSRPPLALLIREGAMTDTQTRPERKTVARRRWSGPAIAFAVMALILAIALPIVLISRTEEPVADTSPEPSPVTGEIQWSKVTIEGFVPSVVPLRDGFVTSRIVESGSEILVSADGSDWTIVDTGLINPGEEVIWRDGGRHGAIAEIGGLERSAVLTTRDGVTWARSDPLNDSWPEDGDVWINDLEVNETGFLGMLGSPPGEEDHGNAPLFSTDGETWTLFGSPPDLVQTTGVGASDSTFLVVGESAADGNPGIEGWLVDETLVWEKVEITPDFVAAADPPVGNGDGFILGGTVWDQETETGDSRIWASVDGRNWDEIGSKPTEAPEYFVIVDASPLGILGFGLDGDDLNLYFSEDAVDWQRWSSADAFGSSGLPEVRWEGAAVGADRIIVTRRVDSTASSTEIWTGFAAQ